MSNADVHEVADRPYAGSRMTRRTALERVERVCWGLALAMALPQLAAVSARSGLSSAVNDAQWSHARREAYAGLLARGGLPAPVGHLRLSGPTSVVPVFSGTTEAALTLGAGHLPETGALSGRGNIAIAGHRDGFFRALRHVRVGDRVSLTASGSERLFRVVDARVVAPEDVWVLEPTPVTTLTLITCHPFYYAGHAPERYVVRARLVREPGGGGGSGSPPASRVSTLRPDRD